MACGIEPLPNATTLLDTFATWWDAWTATRGEPITNLCEQVRPGVLPFRLLEVLDGLPAVPVEGATLQIMGVVVHARPKQRKQRLANLQAFLNVLVAHDISVVVTAEDLADGYAHAVISLTWELIRRYDGPFYDMALALPTHGQCEGQGEETSQLAARWPLAAKIEAVEAAEDDAHGHACLRRAFNLSSREPAPLPASPFAAQTAHRGLPGAPPGSIAASCKCNALPTSAPVIEDTTRGNRLPADAIAAQGRYFAETVVESARMEAMEAVAEAECIMDERSASRRVHNEKAAVSEEPSITRRIHSVVSMGLSVVKLNVPQSWVSVCAVRGRTRPERQR